MKIVNKPFQNGIQGQTVVNAPMGVGGGINPLTRYITTNSAAGSMYDQFSSPVVLTDDYEWEMQYSGTATAGSTIIGSVADGRLCSIETGGVLRTYEGTESVDSTTAINDGKLWTIGVKRESTTLSVLVNSSVENTLTAAGVAGSITIDAIMRFVSAYTDGGWLNLKIWTGGDRTTGTLVVDAAKDGDGSTNVIGNAAAALGSDIWAFNPIVVDGTTDMYQPIAGTYGNNLTPNSSYLVNVSWVNLTGKASLLIGDTIYNIGQTSNDTASASFLAFTTEVTNRTVLQEQTEDGTTADSITITIQEIPTSTPLLNRINQTTNEVALYQFDGDSSPNTWTDVDDDLNVIEIAGT